MYILTVRAHLALGTKWHRALLIGHRATYPPIAFATQILCAWRGDHSAGHASTCSHSSLPVSLPWGSAEPLLLLFSGVLAALPSSHCILRQVGLHLQIFLAKPSKHLEASANHLFCSVSHFSFCFSKCGY